jgi:hypothetical protein
MPNTYQQRRLSVLERFWSHVDRSGGPQACWLWHGTVVGRYGQFYVGRVAGRRGKQTRFTAHRWIYEETYGVLLPGFLVCHDCPGGDNPRCVNLAHLWPGTIWDNAQDAITKWQAHTGRPSWTELPPECVRRGERHHKARLTAAQVLEIRALRGRVTEQVLAARFGVGASTIHSIMVHESWRHLTPDIAPPPSLRRGSVHHAAKLTEAQVLEIRALRGVVTQKELARRFGIAQAVVSAIQLGKTWAHVRPSLREKTGS